MNLGVKAPDIYKNIKFFSPWKKEKICKLFLNYRHLMILKKSYIIRAHITLKQIKQILTLD